MNSYELRSGNTSVKFEGDALICIDNAGTPFIPGEKYNPITTLGLYQSKNGEYILCGALTSQRDDKGEMVFNDFICSRFNANALFKFCLLNRDKPLLSLLIAELYRKHKSSPLTIMLCNAIFYHHAEAFMHLPVELLSSIDHAAIAPQSIKMVERVFEAIEMVDILTSMIGTFKPHEKKEKTTPNPIGAFKGFAGEARILSIPVL